MNSCVCPAWLSKSGVFLLESPAIFTVHDVLSSGMSLQEIIDDFPELVPEDIYAVLAFAADREHMDYALAVE